ncbi:ATPase involved in chromosome partitioning [Rivularia sp. PCC 7116]|uniref:GumC family protein n=1 Tax=Rivularia sp. PCC 7116 TaxID=373994 RepID=UPI00029ED925|nr:polysaccharide biosynthesis tyrosine autokinase [Rivularia sp. PCC 7116]AFY59078.1 ATPase involved in chromosome partitioning [Rivularia sp. PCC 7116]
MESRESVDLDLEKFWYIIKRRWLSAAFIFTICVGAAAVLGSFKKPVFEAQGKLLIKKVNQTSALTGLGQEIGQLEGLDLKSSPINTEIEVISSKPILIETIRKLKLKDDEGATLEAKELAKIINLRAIPATDVLQISYESKNPKEAGDVVNELMNLYIENNIQTNRAAAVAAGDFIAKQLPETQNTVNEAERKLRQFQQENNVISLEEESRNAIVIQKELETRITETRVTLAEVTARFQSLQSKIGMNFQDAINSDSLKSSTGVQQVLQNLQQVENDLAIAQTRFFTAHPTVQSLIGRRNALQRLLNRRVAQVSNTTGFSRGNLQIGEVTQKLTEELIKSEVETVALKNRLNSLLTALEIHKQRINRLPKLEQTEKKYERQLETAITTHENLLQKLQEVRVTENQNIGNARIIEPAFVANKSIKSTKILFLILGGALGTLIATAMIVLLELKDRSVKTLKEIRKLFGYTLLSTIPSLKKKSHVHNKDANTLPDIPVRDNPDLPIADAYRMLQANLKFISADKPLQVIVVTSSVPKEGKSTVSANLAAAIAQLGQRVLLVDADMQSPLQHNLWGVNNVKGLSDIIVGQVEFETVVSGGMLSLDILTAGATTPNPLFLLDSRKMETLIEDFKNTYDFVIIDAPSLVMRADALALGKMADGVLLVARPGILTSADAATAKEALERSGQNLLGMVVNGVIPENESESYFYYAKDYSDKDNSHPEPMKTKSF